MSDGARFKFKVVESRSKAGKERELSESQKEVDEGVPTDQIAIVADLPCNHVHDVHTIPILSITYHNTPRTNDSPISILDIHTAHFPP
jgi:hypothetical protein